MKSNETQTRVERVEEETIQDALSDPQRVQTLDTLLSRRNVLRGLSGGTLALMAGATLTGAEQAAEAGPAGVGRTRDTNLDIQILNFALHAEYLEGEFYTYAFTGQGMTANGIDVTGVDGSGNPVAVGPTTGGTQNQFHGCGRSVGRQQHLAGRVEAYRFHSQPPSRNWVGSRLPSRRKIWPRLPRNWALIPRHRPTS